MRRQDFISDICIEMIDHEYKWLGSSWSKLLRLQKSVLRDLANAARYGKWEFFVSDLNKLGLGVYKDNCRLGA